MELGNTVALITGASQGIGKSTAIALSKQGANVIINFNSNEKLASEVLKECNKNSKKNIRIKANIANEEEVGKMFDEIARKYGKLDILVNNAGIFDELDSPTNLDIFEKIFSVNFLSQVRVSTHALNIMKYGKIVNVSSIYGRTGYGRPEATAYSAMKSALNSYTKNLAKALAPKILVNAIAPGKTITPMWGNLEEKEKKELETTQLINRFILPEEIAEGIIFLIKNDAMCGEILTIDRGMSLKTID